MKGVHDIAWHGIEWHGRATRYQVRYYEATKSDEAR